MTLKQATNLTVGSQVSYLGHVFTVERIDRNGAVTISRTDEQGHYKGYLAMYRELSLVK